MADPSTFVVVVPTRSYGINEAYRNVVGAAGYFAANNVFSRLVVYDTGSPQVFGDLAVAWSMSPDCRTVTFQLNERAAWQDGVPLTAHDVAYTHRTAIEHGYHAGSFLTDVETIEVESPYVVRYRLRRPNAGFYAKVGNLVFAHVLPQHLYEGTDWAANPHNEMPVGSGPFRVVEHEPERHILMEKWADYWGVPAGVDRVLIRIEPDRDECVRMVADGRAHYIVQDVLTYPRLHLADGATHADLWRKRGPGIACLGFNYTQPRWADRDARLAIAAAIDRSQLQALADPGWSEPYANYLPRSVAWALDEDAVAPGHDAELARRLAVATGLTSGDPLRLAFLGTFAGHRGIANSVAADLAAVGIGCEVIECAPQDWRTQVEGAADFDLVLSGGNMVPDPEITSNRFETGGRRNAARLSNPAADACYQRARSAADRDERGAAYQELQRVWADNVDWIPLFWYAAYYLRSTSFTGWSDQVGYSVPFWHWGRIRPVPDAPIDDPAVHDPASAALPAHDVPQPDVPQPSPTGTGGTHP